MSKEEIIRMIKGYEHDKYFGANQNVLPEHEYEYVANDIIKLSDQNTKPLIEEIAELRKEVEYQKSGYVTLKEYLKTDDIFGAIMKLKSELKASKSEANEVVEFAEWCGNKYVKLHSAWVSRYVYKTDSKLYHTTTELYEIFKTLNNKQNEKI